MPSDDRRYSTRRWRRVRVAILDRDRNVCQIRERGCTHFATTVDHVVAVVDGGDFWNPYNLRAACAPCNYARGQRLAAARSARYRNSVAPYESRW